MANEQDVDADQWEVAFQGDLAFLTSKLNGGTYNIPSRILRKAMAAGHWEEINKALQVTPEMKQCKCPVQGRPSCQNIITRGLIFRNRMLFYQNYPQHKEYAANLLRHWNDPVTRNLKEGEEQKRPRIKYFFDNIHVCRRFYLSALGIDHRVGDEISHMVLGREEKPQSHVPQLKGGQKFLPCTVCKAFWTDFFSMCQTPAAGKRLFPVNQSYQLIYACKFIPWWIATHAACDRPVTEPQSTQDVPLGADSDLACVQFEKEDTTNLDWKHDQDHCNFEEPQESEEIPVSQGPSQETDDHEEEDPELSFSTENPFLIKPPLGCPSFSTFYRSQIHTQSWLFTNFYICVSVTGTYL
jgi:hypothetical protein